MPAPPSAHRQRRLTGLVALVLAIGWCFTLLISWNEISVLVDAGFSKAALSVFGHQLTRWIVVSTLFAGVWFLCNALATRTRVSPTVASILATSLAISPLLLLLIYQSSISHGIYFGNFFSRGFVRFALSSGFQVLLTWLLAAVGVELWRRISDKKSGRAISAVTFTLAVLTALVAVLFVRPGATSDVNRPPNVVLIVVDALRPDHLGTYGYGRPTSRNIDVLAAEGVQFETAISQSTLTKTSIASLFTGLDPHHHGVYSGHRLTDGRIYSDVLPESLRTLAGELQTAGYVTAAWLQQSQLKAASGYGRGFLFYNENSRDIGTINRRFLAWLQRIGQSAPIFAYLHYIDLHDPYRPLPPYDSLYGESGDIHANLDYAHWKRTLEKIQTGELELDQQDVDQLIGLYDGQLTFIDEQLGRLFETLRARSLLDNSIIVLTSDHGDGFMEHGFISHSVKPYDELIRVPLIVRLPDGASAGARVEKQVRLIDVMPSILGRLGLPLPADLDGQSVWGSIEDNPTERLAVSEVEMQVEGGYEYFASIRSRTWKLMGDSRGPTELYNLQSDPGEWHNRIGDSSPAIDRLIDTLRKASEARQTLQVDQTPVDEQTEKDLRALGYIE